MSNPVDSSTIIQPSTSKMCFQNIWCDWVKIGENLFGVRKFSQSCRCHSSEHFCASFYPIWVNNPFTLVRSVWLQCWNAPFTKCINVLLHYSEWFGDISGFFFRNQIFSQSRLSLSMFWSIDLFIYHFFYTISSSEINLGCFAELSMGVDNY